MEKICEYCGKSFHVRPSATAQRFCSRTCCDIGRRESVESRFWRHVQGMRSCWRWTGLKNRYGYGRMWDSAGIETIASRVSWNIHRGAIPPGLCVLHKCDNRSCVNPDHLFLGTLDDNMKDKMSKGRQYFPGPKNPVKGIEHHNAKLTPADVRAIRQLRQTGMSQQALAKKFGVDQTGISMLLRGMTWKHVA